MNLFSCQNTYKLFTVELTSALCWLKTLDKVNSLWRNACYQLFKRCRVKPAKLCSVSDDVCRRTVTVKMKKSHKRNSNCGWTDLLSERCYQLIFTLLTVFRPIFEIDDIHSWEGPMFICCVSWIMCLVHSLSNTVHFLYHCGLFSTVGETAALSCILQDFPVTWSPRWEPLGVF